ncbi:MAG: FMN-binding glutamate synthase family protein [Candidatus Aenigmatarchaeota archaeon]
MEEWVGEVKQRALLGKPLISGGRSNKLGKYGFDDLTFVPKQLTGRPIDYFKEEIKSETIIGKTSKHPLKLSGPIMISAMSFGSLSKEAKIALAKASSMAGTCTNTGEGGMLPEERTNAKILIAQYSTGRFGVDDNYINSADAIEIKIGQGAKPGQGGMLPADKVTEEISKLRGVPMGKDVHSPPSHPDIVTINDLKNKVKWLRKITDGKPIIIKIGAGNVEKDIKLAMKAKPDAIAIDGMEGGTGAAPRIMLDDFGIPTLSAIVIARKAMGKTKQELIVSGGLSKGADVAKALALGADAVYMAMPCLVAMGCIYCKQCFAGKCPVGITTQIPELRSKLVPDEAAMNIAKFLTSCTEEVKMAAGACGKKNIHLLNRDDLRSLSLLAEKVTKIPLA